MVNDVTQTAQMICARRGVAFRSIESVAFNVRIDFGFVSGTELLPTTANVFYYIKKLYYLPCITNVAGTPVLELGSNSGQGSVGQIFFRMFVSGETRGISNIEVDFLTYLVSSMTAGNFLLVGEIYKVTYV